MAEEAMRMELDMKLKARELALLEEVVAGCRGMSSLIRELGVLSRLVLAGAGGLIFVWGLSKFCSAVVLPYLPRRSQGRRRKGSATPASP